MNLYLWKSMAFHLLLLHGTLWRRFRPLSRFDERETKKQSANAIRHIARWRLRCSR